MSTPAKTKAPPRRLATPSKPPLYLTPVEFAAKTRNTRMNAEIYAACKMIVTERATWQQASRKCGVTKSGVFRALKRAGLR